MGNQSNKPRVDQNAPLPKDDNLVDGVVEAAFKVKASQMEAKGSSVESLNALIHVLQALMGEEAVSQLGVKCLIILICEAIFTLATIAEIMSNGWIIDHLAIQARDPNYLFGIMFSVFLHGSLLSLLIDVVPFAVLAALVMLRFDGIRVFGFLSAVSVIIGGTAVFLLARPHIPHTCCGGLIFCYFSYLLLYGAFANDFRATIISIVVFVLYGGMVWSLLPTSSLGGSGDSSLSMAYTSSMTTAHSSVSWESHCVGLLLGAGCGIKHAKMNAINQDQEPADDSETRQEKKRLLDE